jgi:peptidoglycan-associated lipoprotein
VGAACSKTRAATAPPAPPAPAPTAPPTTTVAPEKPFESTKPDATVEALPADVAEINRRHYLEDVFYEFDKAEIRDDQRGVLTKDADWLRKYPSIRFRIEGHCDERGTAQYNLALGERRANAAKEYLASLGIDASRMETVSYGKERPFDPGHDESAWSKNRRAHFLVTAR